MSFPVTNVMSLTIESVEMLLKQCAEKILGSEMWSEQKSILELGASSFDVVRLANHLGDELRGLATCTSSSLVRADVNVTELVEYLLEKPLSQVAVCIHNTYSSDVEIENSIHSGCHGDVREGKHMSAHLQKRSHVAHDDEPLPKKPCKVELERTSVIVSKETELITCWRRGQCFVNGRYMYIQS